MTRSYSELPQMNMPFTGAKLAILHAGRVVTLLRDARRDIPYPAHWDLPGGGREADEGPERCALRELDEELGLTLGPQDIGWGRPFGQGNTRTWFFVSLLAWDPTETIRLGDEGQAWDLMPVNAFLSHPRAVPHFQQRPSVFLEQEFSIKAPRSRSSGGR